MAFELPPLPYPKNALEPHTSAQTLDFHHGKHHQAYVDQPQQSGQRHADGEPVARGDHPGDRQRPVEGRHLQQRRAGVEPYLLLELHEAERRRQRRAAMSRRRSTATSAASQKFKDDFKARAVGQFGSGWAWLVASGGKLSITSTPNAVDPMAQGQTALLTCDVWEHAYYLDLPEPPARFRAGVSRPPDQLGLRRPEPGKGEVAAARRSDRPQSRPKPGPTPPPSQC